RSAARRAFLASRGYARRLCRRARRLFRPPSANQRETLWMLNRLNRQINIQFRPIKMVRTGQFNLDQFANASVLKPWELLEGNKALSLSDQKPKTVTGNISDFDRRGGCSKPL